MSNTEKAQNQRGKLTVAVILVVGAFVFLYTSYLGPRLAAQREKVKQQEAENARVWEEGKPIPGAPMPSPELALAYTDALVAATFENYDVSAEWAQ